MPRKLDQGPAHRTGCGRSPDTVATSDIWRGAGRHPARSRSTSATSATSRMRTPAAGSFRSSVTGQAWMSGSVLGCAPQASSRPDELFQGVARDRCAGRPGPGLGGDDHPFLGQRDEGDHRATGRGRAHATVTDGARTAISGSKTTSTSDALKVRARLVQGSVAGLVCQTAGWSIEIALNVESNRSVNGGGCGLDGEDEGWGDDEASGNAGAAGPTAGGCRTVSPLAVMAMIAMAPATSLAKERIGGIIHGRPSPVRCCGVVSMVSNLGQEPVRRSGQSRCRCVGAAPLAAG